MKYKQKLLKLLNRAAMYESTNPQFEFKQFLIDNTLILAPSETCRKINLPNMAFD